MEYTFRYGKVHKTESSGIFQNLSKIPYELPGGKFTEPPQCMPDDCKDDDPVVAYRNYYVSEKSYMARWKNTDSPTWYKMEIA
jgi:hypothetical protein